MRLNVWDFGGQEIMHATHQFFLTERSLYLLVLSGREGGEDADAEYWLKLIQSFGGDSPVVVVLNKIKEHPFDVNRSALQAQVPVHPRVRQDRLQGCDRHRRVAPRRRARDGQARTPARRFPGEWFSIKDKLAGMEKNYLSFEESGRSARSSGEDPRRRSRLAFHLHNLGIALNYKDDPRLQDTHVLNPSG